MSDQGTDAWTAERRGKVTASRIADMVAKTKTGWGASRANYAAQLVAERLTNETAPGYTNEAMRWGTETEPQARAAYEFFRDASVTETGFVTHAAIAMSGASPDGLVADDGLVEIKCPNTATHIETLLGGSIPGKYSAQMQWQMACTNRKWCDFVSFDPRMPQNMSLFVKRLMRNDVEVATLETEVRAFLVEVDATVTRLTELYGKRAA